MRDLLGMVATQKEVMQVLTRKAGARWTASPRHDPGFPVGLFDVVSIPKEGKAFRLVPSPDGLVPGTSSPRRQE